MKKADILIALGVLTPILVGKKGQGSFARMSKYEFDDFLKATTYLYNYEEDDNGKFLYRDSFPPKDAEKYFDFGGNPFYYFCSKKWLSFSQWSRAMQYIHDHNDTPGFEFTGPIPATKQQKKQIQSAFGKQKVGLDKWKEAVKGTKGVKFKISRDGNIKGGFSCWIRASSMKDLERIISFVQPDELMLYTKNAYRRYEREPYDYPRGNNPDKVMKEKFGNPHEQFDVRLKKLKQRTPKGFPIIIKSAKHIPDDEALFYVMDDAVDSTDRGNLFGMARYNMDKSQWQAIGSEGCSKFKIEKDGSSYSNWPARARWTYTPIALADDGKIKGNYYYANLQWDG
jgi:hypothetical protein